ncbi:lysoplasmalogenase [Skermania sp. ID1734]|uniref:lysoplasmalogenase n=1 Tax=Skermania sp. ID1734 TaxID=2597516 RepID=UPI00117DC005|nr:lysoplasmalogenase [Skermania sp. ID1734]TSD94447.1 lysoplasmalogenase [Skermania sp. ID1734]
MRAEHAVYAAASVATVYGALSDREWVQQVAKPLIGPSLAVRAVRSGDWLLVGSLAAATVGDILLIEPDDDRRLTRGALSFAGMQSGYAIALWRRGARPTTPALAPRIVGWLGASVLLRARARAVAPTLTGYGVTLAVATTLASDPTLAPESSVVGGLAVPGADRRSWLGLGALLFTVSDALIVVRRVLLRSSRAKRYAEGVILATYAAAQGLLVEGMLAQAVDERVPPVRAGHQVSNLVEE